MRIAPFRGEYAFLSNMYSVPVLYDGIIYPSSENAYQAQKVEDRIIRMEIAGLTCVQAKQFKYKCRKAGRKIIFTPDFDMRKVDVMTRIVEAKFNQNIGIAQRLIDTGDHELVEEGWWHDNFWGNCTCGRAECKQEGFNQLGVILMNTRNMILQDIHTEEFHETA
jgi:hypothetical protein